MVDGLLDELVDKLVDELVYFVAVSYFDEPSAPLVTFGL